MPGKVMYVVSTEMASPRRYLITFKSEVVMLMVTSSEGGSAGKAPSLRVKDREGRLAEFCKVSRTVMREDRSTVSVKDSLRVPASISREKDSTSGAVKSAVKFVTRCPLSRPTGITGLPNTSWAAPDVSER